VSFDWIKIFEYPFRRPTPDGSAAVGGTVSTSLPSGYDRLAEVAKAVERLTKLQAGAISMFPATPLPGGRLETKCNWGLQHVAHGLGCDDLVGTASQIVQRATALCASQPSLWREDSWARAVNHAQKGGLAIIGYGDPLPGEQHCHVLTVAAKPMETSGTWGCPVPIGANVGKPDAQGFFRISKCFLLAHKPLLKCLLWKSDETL